MKKKVLAGMLTAVMVLGSVSVEADEEVTIQVFSNQADRTSGQGLIEQTLFDMYMEENPNVTIQVETLDDESYKTKFKAYASGSDMPDLVNIWGQPSFLSEVIDAGLLAELDPEDYKDYGFMKGALEGFSSDGKLYGLSRNTDVMGFYYNKEIFQECGAEVPDTYEELLDTVKTVADRGFIPVAMAGADKWPLAVYVEDAFNKLHGKGTFKAAREAVETGNYDDQWKSAVDMLGQMVDAGGFQEGFETTDYGTAQYLFTSGQAAMFYMGSWEMSMAANENLPEDFRNSIGVFSMPAGEGSAGKTTDICAWSGGGYAVTAKSKVKEEAIRLLNYMFLPDHWTRLAWEKGVCMSAQDFGAYVTGKENSLQTTWINIVNNATSFSGIVVNDLGTSEFKTICEDAVVEYAIGGITAEELLDRLSEAAD